MATSSKRGTDPSKTPCLFYARGHCARGDSCYYQHGGSAAKRQAAEAKKDKDSQSPLFKTELCAFYKTGDCMKGPTCVYAHGEHELRKKLESTPPQGSSSRPAPRKSLAPEARVNMTPAPPTKVAPWAYQPEAFPSLTGASSGPSNRPAIALAPTVSGQSASAKAKEPARPVKIDLTAALDHPAKGKALPTSSNENDNEFFCPITHEMFIRPVVASDGFSYEADAIKQWLISHATSPLTNERLDPNILVPNHTLKQAIQRLYGVR